MKPGRPRVTLGPNDPAELRPVPRRYVRDLRPVGLPPLMRYAILCHVACEVQVDGATAMTHVHRLYTLIARSERQARDYLERTLPPYSRVFAPMTVEPVRSDGLYSAPVVPGTTGVDQVTDPEVVASLREAHARLRRLSRKEGTR